MLESILHNPALHHVEDLNPLEQPMRAISPIHNLQSTQDHTSLLVQVPLQKVLVFLYPIKMQFKNRENLQLGFMLRKWSNKM